MADSKCILGPFDVALEEPVYFNITPNADGKTIQSVEMINGFVHRGMESIVLKRNFLQNLIITEKVCGLCSNNHPFTYCMAVEKLSHITIPRRAAYLRVIADETKRIASHLFNVAMLAHLLKRHSLMGSLLEAREHFQDIKEQIWGNRMDLSANVIGGVKYDLNSEKIAFMKEKMALTRTALEAIVHIFETDESLKKRIQGVGVLPHEKALSLGVVGPVARASGVNNDVRFCAPYAVYDALSFKVITRSEGDVYARAMVRLYEIFESMSLLEQAFDALPKGEIALHVKSVVPKGEATSRSEAPRGELMYYLKSNGTQKPERMKWRVPSYMNWEALKVMLKGNAIEDVALIFNSIDPCISCSER